MSDRYYLVDHPPASSQYRNPRRYVLSGLVVPHTAEGGPALNVARFVSTRSDPGSYHELVDPDGSHVALMPDGWEAFHVAADSHNRHAWGVSAACRAVDFCRPGTDELTDGMLVTMAARIVAFAERNGFDPQSARWVDRAEALRIRDAAAAGRRSSFLALCDHGRLQPADRSDAWAMNPQRAELDDTLVELIRSAGTAPAPTREATRMIDTVTIPPDARTELAGCGVEVRAAGTVVLIRWQVDPLGAWTDFQPIPTPEAPPAPLAGVALRVNPFGALQVVAWPAGSVNAVTAWQSVPGGAWSGWAPH